jgi:hypothetical protein
MANKIRFSHGNEAITEGAIAAGARFYAGYPITPILGNSRTVISAFAPSRRSIHPNGRRNRQHCCNNRSLSLRQEVLHRNKRSRLFPYARKPGRSSNGGNSLRNNKRTDDQGPAQALQRNPPKAT